MRRAVTEIKTRGVDLAVVNIGGDHEHAPAGTLYEKLEAARSDEPRRPARRPNGNVRSVNYRLTGIGGFKKQVRRTSCRGR